MVKLRDARYCNLKLLLIYLVIYGHLIEPGIWQSKILMIQYKWIYLFHMPAFCFLSGLFLNNSKACSCQCLRMVLLYALLQSLAVFLGNGRFSPLTPYWHLWYLLSYSTWAALGWIWFRCCRGKGKTIIMVCSIVAGCLAGLHPDIGREYSLSRTLVFFPFFFLGLISDSGFPWQKLRLWGLAAIVIVFALMALWGNRISAVFLYQAAPYGRTENGVQLRLICYLLGALICVFLLSITPMQRFPFTRVGADTMPAYLIHAPIVLIIRELDIPWPYHLLIAGAILYATYKLLQWHSRLYGIVPTERRGGRCPLFRKSMKNMLSQFTDSYYP